jgi:hypothetical protein
MQVRTDVHIRAEKLGRGLQGELVAPAAILFHFVEKIPERLKGGPAIGSFGYELDLNQ